MDASVASSTAVSVSLIGAVHARTARHPILNGAWGEILLPTAVSGIIQQKMPSAPAQTSALANTDDTRDEMDGSVLSQPALANCKRHTTINTGDFFSAISVIISGAIEINI